MKKLVYALIAALALAFVVPATASAEEEAPKKGKKVKKVKKVTKKVVKKAKKVKKAKDEDAE